jgi:hypothetical protein
MLAFDNGIFAEDTIETIAKPVNNNVSLEVLN